MIQISMNQQEKLSRPETPKKTQERDLRGVWLALAAVVPLLISLVYTVLNEPDPFRNGVSVISALVFVILFAAFEAPRFQKHVTLILALQTAVVAVMCFVPGARNAFYIFVVVAVLCAQIGMELPPRRAAPWFFVILALVIAAYIFAYDLLSGLLIGLGNSAGFFFFAYVGSLIRQSEINRAKSEKLAAELRQANEQLHALNLQTQHLAIAEERNRLARELHDSLGHRLTVAVVQLEGAQRLIGSDPARAARMVGEMREEIKHALTDLRQNVAALRAPLEDDLPLDVALRRLSSAFETNTGLPVQLDLPDTLPALTPAQRLAMYRAGQETLTNAQKHSGAKHVWVALRASAHAISLTTDDDGKGMGEAGEDGFGLRGLRERAALLGGALETGASERGGARVSFSVSLGKDGAA